MMFKRVKELMFYTDGTGVFTVGVDQTRDNITDRRLAG